VHRQRAQPDPRGCPEVIRFVTSVPHRMRTYSGVSGRSGHRVVTGMFNGGVLPPGLTPLVTGACWLPSNRFVDRAGEHLARTSTE